MRLIKLFLISAVILFMLLTAMSVLLPSQIRISRAVDITASPESVYVQLKVPGCWQRWNTYIQALPGKTVTARGIASKKLNVSITKTDLSSVETLWHQANGKSFTGVYKLIPKGRGTILQWYFEFRFRWYPWEKFSSIVYDKQLGPQMEQSLINLKGLLEKE